jgi:hypothetical protein
MHPLGLEKRAESRARRARWHSREGMEVFLATAAREAFVSGLNDIVLVAASSRCRCRALVRAVRTPDFHDQVEDPVAVTERLAA